MVADEPDRPQSRGPVLTRRQRQVLLMVAEGLTYPEIQSRLGLSRWTVTGHLYNARLRLNVPSVASAVWAARRELESPYG